MTITPLSPSESPNNADIITQLDPALIRLPEHPNRDESFFKSPAYYALRSAILITRGNTVPVRVHPISDSPFFKYEADYGICRIRCCHDLQHPVLAIVSTTPLSDQKRLFQRVQENSCRSDFSPVDLGRIYLDALERKLVTNQAEFAHECGRDTGLLSKAIKLASLPAVILDLFDQIQDIQYRYYKSLWDAYSGPNKDRFLQAAETVEQLPRPRNPDEIVAILTGKRQQKESTEASPLERFKPAIETTLNWKGKPTGSVILMEEGQVEIKLDRKLELDNYEDLASTLQSFLDRSGGKLNVTKARQPKGAGARTRNRSAKKSVEELVTPTPPQLDLDLSVMKKAAGDTDSREAQA